MAPHHTARGSLAAVRSSYEMTGQLVGLCLGYEDAVERIARPGFIRWYVRDQGEREIAHTQTDLTFKLSLDFAASRSA